MSKSDHIILVAGATGQQGGATARRLLAEGWRVRALTRDPSSLAAQLLRQAGAEIVEGAMEDRTSLAAALDGAYGAFSVQPPGVGGGFSADDELRLGVAFADAAKEAGVRHIVQTTVSGADRAPGVPHFQSKWRIEQHIRDIDLPATFLRPNTFMEIFFSPYVSIQDDLISFIGRPDAQLPFIAVEDIGAFAAFAFDDPDLFIGETLDLAGDVLSLAEAAAAIGAAIDRPIRYAQFAPDIIGANPIFAALADFIDREGFTADVSELRELHPELLTFDRWLEGQGRARFSALFARKPFYPRGENAS